MNFWEELKKNKPILALAPLAGITDSAQRQLCKYFGADVVYTEMVSVDGLYYDSKKTLELLKLKKEEHPVVLQLFGKDEEKFKKASKIVEQAGFNGVDINFGCPAKKVVAHNGGVTLMRDLDKCRKIIEAVLTSTNLPVSIKIRIGINKIKTKESDGNEVIFELDNDQKNTITALDFIEKIKDLPISAIMIHGRSYEQRFSGDIDDKMIKDIINRLYELKKESRPVVLANGGILSPEDAKITLEKTNADGLGIARGIYGKPFIFSQIKDYLNNGEYEQTNFKLIKKAILMHSRLLFKEKPNKAHLEFRKYILWYTKGIHNIGSLREKMVQIKTQDDVENIVKEVEDLISAQESVHS